VKTATPCFWLKTKCVPSSESVSQVPNSTLRTSTTCSALKGEPLISLVPGNLVQQFIDKHLARAGVFIHPRAMFNYLDTMIAMVEAGEGVAVIPSFALPACRNRKLL
jgi:DNA-binding transcriptional LysR family regulator